MNFDDIVLVMHENQYNLAFRVLFDQLLTNSWENNLLIIDHDPHGTSAGLAFWDQFNLCNT